MPRFLLAPIVALTALTFTLALTARAWGETQPPHPDLRGFVEGCAGIPQPCWYGIVPGETPFSTVADTLTRLGYAANPNSGSIRTFTSVSPSQVPGSISLTVNCSNRDCTHVPIQYLYLFDWKHVQLGAVMSVIGFPSTVFAGPAEHYLSIGISYLDVIPRREWSSPFEPVKTLLLPGLTESSQRSTGQPWRGFVEFIQYCRLEPAFADCD
jgi:hypothetical protein